MNLNLNERLLHVSKSGSPRWLIWFTAILLSLMFIIAVATFVSIVARFNGNETIAKWSLSISATAVIIAPLLTVTLFSVLWWRGWSNLPSLSKSELLFDEKFSGGYSLLSWHTRRFPAKNNLHVSIARETLWIRPQFLASLSVAYGLDQIHQIPLEAIVEVDSNKYGTDIMYRSPTGVSRSVRLWLRKNDEFLTAVRSTRHGVQIKASVA